MRATTIVKINFTQKLATNNIDSRITYLVIEIIKLVGTKKIVVLDIDGLKEYI